MIKTFRSRDAELLAARKSVPIFHAVEIAQAMEQVTRRKLAQLNAAEELGDLAVPSSNCLESTSFAGDQGHRIRVSYCWELRFLWRRDAYDVDLVRRSRNPVLVRGKRENGLLPAIYPGEILQDFMRPSLIGVTELAYATGLPKAQLTAVISGQLEISADIAFRLGRFFHTTPSFWLNLQRDYEQQLAESARLAAIG